MTGGPEPVQEAEDAVLALAPLSPLPLTSLGQTHTFPEISQWGGKDQDKRRVFLHQRLMEKASVTGCGGGPCGRS